MESKDMDKQDKLEKQDMQEKQNKLEKQEKHRRSEDIDFAAIGKRLRIARKRCGLSAVEASKKSGIHPATISALELNKRNAGLVALFTFCRAYDCSLDEIVFGASSIPSGLNGSTDSSDSDSNSDSASVRDNGVEDESDPYFIALKESMAQMDENEKEFMVRLVLSAHQEFAIVRNKMKSGL